MPYRLGFDDRVRLEPYVPLMKIALVAVLTIFIVSTFGTFTLV